MPPASWPNSVPAISRQAATANIHPREARNGRERMRETPSHQTTAHRATVASAGSAVSRSSSQRAPVGGAVRVTRAESTAAPSIPATPSRVERSTSCTGIATVGDGENRAPAAWATATMAPIPTLTAPVAMSPSAMPSASEGRLSVASMCSSCGSVFIDFR